MTKLYQGENCPCIYVDCERYGKCKECIAFHHEKGEQTYCEKLNDASEERGWLDKLFNFVACPS